MGEIKAGVPAGAFSDVDGTGEQNRYVAYLDEARAHLREFSRARYPLLQLHPGNHVLDLGCGTGEDIIELAALVGSEGRAVGVDSSETMIAEGRKRSAQSGMQVEFRKDDAHRLDFPDASFDACYAERLFQHLAEPEGALVEIIRVIKPGGRIVVADTDHDMLAIDATDRDTTRAIRGLNADMFRAGLIGRADHYRHAHTA